MTTLVANHVKRGLSMMLSQYRNSFRLKGVVSAFLQQVQDVENAAFDCIVNTRLESAGGVNLDRYGRVFDVSRSGLSDDEYRNVIKVKILAYRSGGLIKNITDVAAGLFGSPARYRPLHGAAYTISVFTDVPASIQFAKTAIDILYITRPAGVILADFLESETNCFTFDDDNGWDTSLWGTRDLTEFSSESGFVIIDPVTSGFSTGFDSGF